MDPKILEVLRELENIKGRESLFWNVPRTTGEFLNILVRVSGAKKALEIGTSNGYSGIYIAEGLSHNGGLLYTVESNGERFRLAAKNFAAAGVADFVRQVKGHAPEILPEVAKVSGVGAGVNVGASGFGAGLAAGSVGGAGVAEVTIPAAGFDLIFIDATKMEYKSYVAVLLPMLRTGGMIIADNCLSHADEVREYVSYLNSCADMQNVLLPVDNGLLLSLKAG
jgi:predicted O-methyltransferase YrrM